MQPNTKIYAINMEIRRDIFNLHEKGKHFFITLLSKKSTIGLKIYARQKPIISGKESVTQRDKNPDNAFKRLPACASDFSNKTTAAKTKNVYNAILK